MIDPPFFAVNFFQELFCQGDSRSARRILLFRMMDLRYPGFIVGMGRHQRGEALVQFKENVNAHAEIAGIQKSSMVLREIFPDGMEPAEPAGGAADDGYTGLQSAENIVISAFRACELYGSIRLLKPVNRQILQV